MNNTINESAGILKALGHPTRLCITKGLIENACNVNHMVHCLKVPQATISQHLRVLKSEGIIEGTRKGVEICYSVTSPLAKKIIEFIE